MIKAILIAFIIYFICVIGFVIYELIELQGQIDKYGAELVEAIVWFTLVVELIFYAILTFWVSILLYKKRFNGKWAYIQTTAIFVFGILSSLYQIYFMYIKK